MKPKGLFLVLAQFGLLALWAASGELISCTLIGKLFQIEGLLIIIWAVYTMNQSKLNVFPELKQGASLVTTGPYKFVRHPMYSGILFLVWGSFQLDSVYRIALALALTLVLYIKSSYEDELLTETFPEYRSYKEITGRFLPKF
jgi:protein-S-isoprenylcysteine O-methyltransferase Ste14